MTVAQECAISGLGVRNKPEEPLNNCADPTTFEAEVIANHGYWDISG